MPPKFISSPGEMPATADVVIIGGGPAGTAALWALERQDPTLSCVLLEKAERLGAGSTLASLENYRSCWPTPCLAQMMRRSIEVFHAADDYLGNGAAQVLALNEQGYLFCAFDDVQASQLREDVDHLHHIGLRHIEYLDANEVRARFGWLNETVIAAMYDPLAGWLDSNALIYRYVQSTQRAQIILSVAEIEISVEGGRAIGVRTSAGNIASPNVVIAAGAWSRAVGRSAGVELPINLRPRQSFTTGWRHPEFPENAPMLIGPAPYAHVRPEAQDGAIFGWEYHWHNKYAGSEYGSNAAHDAIIEPVMPVSQLKDMRFPSITLALLADQFGDAPGQGFANTRYLRNISHNIGYYTYRDDTTAYQSGPNGERQPYMSERAIIDAVPDVSGLFMSVAHVGHGIMSSPAAGEILASKVLGQPLADPVYADFGIDIPWVEHDEGVL